MMVGKRSGRPAPARNHMRRTTSMTEFTPPADVLAGVPEEELEDEEAELQLLPAHAEGGDQQAAEAVVEDPYGWAIGGAAAAGRKADWLAAYSARATPARRLRRNSADFSAAETAAFLRACGLCNRRLGPGRDTFMYRGDTAFCSLECRQQHITIEEWKEKCALATPPMAPPATAAADPVPVAPLPPAGVASDKPAGTIAAA
ncbi:hypothetical protein HU200_035991 [Digitaria exilis]|uniref:FLZ-type domain-containing protein n=1 Tax=Digitaria exilis TaxID=1010633 RepID=A0A835BQR2_9POAL|nr:hypothetical protein HU200_035991 [Digitaria exilis]CAB3480891.1 unnamed protein product [Digitaria exilis]